MPASHDLSPATANDRCYAVFVVVEEGVVALRSAFRSRPEELLEFFERDEELWRTPPEDKFIAGWNRSFGILGTPLIEMFQRHKKVGTPLFKECIERGQIEVRP